jgi:PadR family transcriptional regulator PadR
MRELTIPEEIFLTSILRLKDEAYGVAIRKNIEKVTGRNIAYGTLYNILAQLVRKGYVFKSRGNPTAERGGRSKMFYSLTSSGVKALQEARDLQKMIWGDLPEIAQNEI